MKRKWEETEGDCCCDHIDLPDFSDTDVLREFKVHIITSIQASLLKQYEKQRRHINKALKLLLHCDPLKFLEKREDTPSLIILDVKNDYNELPHSYHLYKLEAWQRWVVDVLQAGGRNDALVTLVNILMLPDMPDYEEELSETFPEWAQGNLALSLFDKTYRGSLRENELDRKIATAANVYFIKLFRE